MFDPEPILAALVDHGVRFVVIGGIAASYQGSPIPTQDVDITPDVSPANLHRLSKALRALNARVRHPDVPAGLAFSHDAASLSDAVFWNLVTRHGDLDLSFVPAGTTGYDDLARDAVTIVLSGVPVPIASLSDVIRSKDAAGTRTAGHCRRCASCSPSSGTSGEDPLAAGDQR